MRPLVLIGLTALVAVAALRWPVRFGFPALVAVVLLVPAPLVVPNGFTHYPTMHRVVMLAVLAGLLIAVRQNRVAADVFRPTLLHALFGLFVVASLIAGIGLAPAGIPMDLAFNEWLRWFDQAVFFVVILALVRAVDDLERVVLVICAVFGVAVLIAAVEQTIGWSWGQWLFSRLPAQQATDAASGFVFRAGQVRVRAGSEFALEFAWVMLALLPVALLAAARRAPRAPALAAGVVAALGAASVYWTVTRTATALLPVVLVAAAVLARDRAVRIAVAGAVAAGAVLLLASPQLLGPLTLEADLGAATIRSERLPDILALAAARPVEGLGLGALHTEGFPVTDASYLITYAELGAFGLALLLVVLVAALGLGARALLGPAHPLRGIAGVATLGTGTLLVGAFVYDGLHVLGSARIFWLLVAVGLVAADRLVGPLRRPAWHSWRLVPPVAAVGVGFVLATLAPTAHVAHYRFYSVPVEDEAGWFDPVTHGRTLLNTVCAAVDTRGGTFGGATVECRDLFRAAGVGAMRIVADEPGKIEAAVSELHVLARTRLGVPAFRVVEASQPVHGRPTWATTAPVWLGVLGVAAAALFPTPGAPRPPQPATGRPQQFGLATPSVPARRPPPWRRRRHPATARSAGLARERRRGRALPLGARGRRRPRHAQPWPSVHGRQGRAGA